MLGQDLVVDLRCLVAPLARYAMLVLVVTYYVGLQML